MAEKVILQEIITEFHKINDRVERGEISLSDLSEKIDILTVRLENWMIRNYNGNGKIKGSEIK
jgi:hypothetical protein